MPVAAVVRTTARSAFATAPTKSSGDVGQMTGHPAQAIPQARSCDMQEACPAQGRFDAVLVWSEVMTIPGVCGNVPAIAAVGIGESHVRQINTSTRRAP